MHNVSGLLKGTRKKVGAGVVAAGMESPDFLNGWKVVLTRCTFESCSLNTVATKNVKVVAERV